jgi:hypothetical protein
MTRMASQQSKQVVRVILLLLAFEFMGFGQTRTGRDFGTLLGSSVTSPEVQQFIKTNHLRQFSTTPGCGGCNSTNSPFMLFWCSNRVWQVCVALDTVRFEPETFPGYSGKMPHDLTRSDTPETVIERLGTPSRRNVIADRLISLYYDKQHLCLDFEGKSRRLQLVTWME